LLVACVQDFENQVKGGVPAGEVTVPNMESLMASFAKYPDDCTDEEVDGVSFFYHVALATCDKRIKQSFLLEHHDVWFLLGESAVTWASAMAYSMVLVERMSDLENIIHNKKKDQGEQFGDLESANPAFTRKKKKMRSKDAKLKIAKLFVDYLIKFSRMQIRNKNETKEEEDVRVADTRKRFRVWERKVGIIPSDNQLVSGLKKRQWVAPLQDLTNKRQRGEEEEEDKATKLLVTLMTGGADDVFYDSSDVDAIEAI
jgi:hypothetical protein